MRAVVIVEVQSTVGFGWCCPLKWTVGIDATHAFSRNRRGSSQTSLAETVPKWSELTANLEFRRTNGVHHASRTNRMAHIFLVELLRTGESPRILLR